MSPHALMKLRGFQVNYKVYPDHRAYEYVTASAAGTDPVPRVCLYLVNRLKSVSRDVWLLVDTGANMSTLSARSADSLRIHRGMGRRDKAVIFRGVSGHAVAGILRRVHVFLGGALREIRVAIEPNERAMRLLRWKHGMDLLPCKRDLLGRADILVNYLLCFNSKRLYAFPRVGATASASVGV